MTIKLEERFVAFIDILGFKQLISRVEQSPSQENLELQRLFSILNFMDEETYDPNYSSDLPIYVETDNGYVEKELGDPRLTYASDCLAISAEPTLDGFKGLSRKLHKITADLAIDGYFCRGAISKGKVLHANRIFLGCPFIRAMELEKKEAIYPRIIIDPDILHFFDLSNGKMPLGTPFYGLDEDGYYYQRYWTWYLFPPHAGSWIEYLSRIEAHIERNLDFYLCDEPIRQKYVWLKKELSSLTNDWSTNFPMEHMPDT